VNRPLLRQGVWFVALLGGLTGCTTAPRPQPPEEPFVFRALDLRQRDALGAPAWELISPEARYDIARQLAQARQPRGTIYKQGQPHISIRAQSGTVIGDGQAIQLEGDVQITLLGANPIRIQGDQVRWIPRQDLMVIDRMPSAIDRNTRIQAGLARYRIKADQLELRGSTVLEHWQQTTPAAKPSPQGAPLRVQTAWVNWRPDQGDLVASEPVRGLRREGSSELQLRAQGLKGNIRQGYVDLQAPVQVRDPKRQGWLNASTTRWAINDQLLSSDQPVQGAFKPWPWMGAAGSSSRANGSPRASASGTGPPGASRLRGVWSCVAPATAKSPARDCCGGGSEPMEWPCSPPQGRA